jgi:hypothetical protein
MSNYYNNETMIDLENELTLVRQQNADLIDTVGEFLKVISIYHQIDKDHIIGASTRSALNNLLDELSKIKGE